MYEMEDLFEDLVASGELSNARVIATSPYY